MKLLIIGLLGSLGVLLRFGLIQLFPNSSFPWAVLSANVVGSFLAGVIFTLYISSGETQNPLAGFILIGALGGLTTFSSFSLDTVRLMASSAWTLAFINIAMNNLLSIGACYFGVKISQHL